MIRLLYLGDICGKPGREAVAKTLPDLRKKLKVDLVAADVENLAHGRGATVGTVREIMSYGVDFMTGGNHIWRRPEFEELLGGDYPLIRAINYPDDIPGKGSYIIDLGKKGQILFILVQGRTFMQDPVTSDMLRPLDTVLSKVQKKDLKGIVVEVHAEATSEKISTAMYLDGRVSAVVGTHTHVPTADERILRNGTSFITDIGMIGPMESSLWVNVEIVQQQMKYPYAPPYEIEEDGKRRFDAVLIELESAVKSAKITRINKVLSC